MSKTILITGTSSGFGKLTAITLAKEGHSVIAGMRGVNGKNAEVAKELAVIANIQVNRSYSGMPWYPSQNTIQHLRQGRVVVVLRVHLHAEIRMPAVYSKLYSVT